MRAIEAMIHVVSGYTHSTFREVICMLNHRSSKNTAVYIRLAVRIRKICGICGLRDKGIVAKHYFV